MTKNSVPKRRRPFQNFEAKWFPPEKALGYIPNFSIFSLFLHCFHRHRFLPFLPGQEVNRGQKLSLSVPERGTKLVCFLVSQQCCEPGVECRCLQDHCDDDDKRSKDLLTMHSIDRLSQGSTLWSYPTLIMTDKASLSFSNLN